jgi:hypothetical protein
VSGGGEDAAGRARPALHLAATGAAPEVSLGDTVAARAVELAGEPAISLTHTDHVARAVAILR